MKKFKQLFMLALIATFSIVTLTVSAGMALMIRDNSAFEMAEVSENPFVAKVAQRN